MTALAIDALEAVRAAGGDLKPVDPERLKLIAPMPLPDHLVDCVRAAKPELLKLLSSGTSPPATDIWDDAKEERTAIIEYDSGAPRAWAEALARLDPNRPPHDVPATRWVRLIDDCGRFLDSGWVSKAEALGWEPFDLFGCDRHRPLGRIDHAGHQHTPLDGRVPRPGARPVKSGAVGAITRPRTKSEKFSTS